MSVSSNKLSGIARTSNYDLMESKGICRAITYSRFILSRRVNSLTEILIGKLREWIYMAISSEEGQPKIETVTLSGEQRAELMTSLAECIGGRCPRTSFTFYEKFTRR
jgi:hypothetical protein